MNIISALKDSLRANGGGNWIRSAFWSLVIVLIAQQIAPRLVPFGVFDLWQTSGDYHQWLKTSTYVLLWGGGVTLLFSVFSRNTRAENQAAESDFIKGFFISVWAGVAEEICFRWLIFIGAIPVLAILNWIFFGFAGLGLIELLQVHILGPIANWATLGLLERYIDNPANWLIGAALMSSNSMFRNGHRYLGWFGFINSWFIGMFMFYLLFKYGLVACIVVHFVYDLLIFFVRYVDKFIERSFGG
ncbi:MAG: CPBP family intramembrane metalloprotease [Candidatus Obscuribacterales bacterium]|nr:CPBP family intramembrane metalloprotease [Candidatus Obscuribacterales bacterium]